jgi:predicted dehydrogenase
MNVKIALIGLGNIAEKYIKTISQIKELSLVAYCDPKETKIKRNIEDRNKIVDDYTMLDYMNLDYVFVLTPPDTHFKIAKYFLKKNINVFVEKPGTTNIKDLKELISIANKKGLVFDVILHWKYGDELHQISRYFKDIKRVTVSVIDPYYNNGIIPEKVSLGGAWMDSGINVLSMLSKFLDISKFKYVKHTAKNDIISRLDYSTNVMFTYMNSSIEIDITWSKDDNLKETTIYNNNDDVIIISHTNQCVYINNELAIDANQNDRLETHYNNFFKSLNHYEVNYKLLSTLHSILFDIKKEISEN